MNTQIIILLQLHSFLIFISTKNENIIMITLIQRMIVSEHSDFSFIFTNAFVYRILSVGFYLCCVYCVLSSQYTYIEYMYTLYIIHSIIYLYIHKSLLRKTNYGTTNCTNFINTRTQYLSHILVVIYEVMSNN